MCMQHPHWGVPYTMTDGEGCKGDSICLQYQVHKEVPSEKTTDKSEIPAGTGGAAQQARWYHWWPSRAAFGRLELERHREKVLSSLRARERKSILTVFPSTIPHPKLWHWDLHQSAPWRETGCHKVAPQQRGAVLVCGSVSGENWTAWEKRFYF